MTPAELLVSLPAAERVAFLESLSPEEVIALESVLAGESAAACIVRLERVSRLRRMARELATIADEIARRR